MENHLYTTKDYETSARKYFVDFPLEDGGRLRIRCGASAWKTLQDAVIDVSLMETTARLKEAHDDRPAN